MATATSGIAVDDGGLDLARAFGMRRLKALRSPPIPGSSVPQCPCGNGTPCQCEFYARRLELRHHADQGAMLKTSATLRALAAASGSLTVKRSLLKLAEGLV